MLFRCDRKLYISVDTNLKQSVIENRLSKDYCCTFVVLVVVTKEKKNREKGVVVGKGGIGYFEVIMVTNSS